MPREQVRIVVSKPLGDLEAELRRRYKLKQPLVGVSIDRESVVFTFGEVGGRTSFDEGTADPAFSSGRLAAYRPRRRRKRRVRNRTKTRGWDVVAKIRNQRGQTCTIYRPFLDALADEQLTRREAYAQVRKIITANGNDPNPSTVDYFLENTLEYLHRTRSEPKIEVGV